MSKKNVTKGIIDSTTIEEIAKWNMPAVGEVIGTAQANIAASKSQNQATKDYNEAYQKGLQQGFQTGQEKVQQLLAELNQLLAIIDEPVKLIEKQIEEELLAMVVELSKACIKQELTINPALIINAIEQLKKVLPASTSEKTLMLNPEDFVYVQNLLEKGDLQLQSCKLVADEHLARGESQILSDTSEVDGTLAARMMAVTDKVFEDVDNVGQGGNNATTKP